MDYGMAEDLNPKVGSFSVNELVHTYYDKKEKSNLTLIGCKKNGVGVFGNKSDRWML